MRFSELSQNYHNMYNRNLKLHDVRDLPFVRIEDAPIDNNSNGGKLDQIITLVIELDDCCNQCRYKYCKLLHSVQQVMCCCLCPHFCLILCVLK